MNDNASAQRAPGARNSAQTSASLARFAHRRAMGVLTIATRINHCLVDFRR